VFMFTIDFVLASRIENGLPWITVRPDVAQSILTTIAGAMVTVAGVVFSITIVTLSLVTQQLGPRLLRRFMENRSTQIMMGSLIGLSIYAFLILGAVRAGETSFVPYLSVALATAGVVVELGLLVYFFHNMAVSVQAESIIESVSVDLDESIERLYPDHIDETSRPLVSHEAISAQLARWGENCQPVPASRDGYLQAVDVEALIGLAEEHEFVVHIKPRPGDFVVKDDPLLMVWRAKSFDDDLVRELRGQFYLGRRPTPRQDVLCAIDELVEVAIRALSPGINDPYTTRYCVDHLGAALQRLALRQPPVPFHVDSRNELRLVWFVRTFTDVLDHAMYPLRQYGASHPMVMVQLLRMLQRIAETVRREEDGQAVLEHARHILDESEREFGTSVDITVVQKLYKELESGRNDGPNGELRPQQTADLVETKPTAAEGALDSR
ncbi:MAG: DUF2254 domain-containing protein, partial [Candidatus Hydrogenedentales bacterium]